MTPSEATALQIEIREVQGLEASSPLVSGVVVDGQLVFVARSIVTDNPVRVAHLPQDAALSIAVLNAGAKACTGPLVGPPQATTGPLPLAVMRSNAVPPPDDDGLPPHSLTWLGWFPLTLSAGGPAAVSGARICVSVLFEGAALLAPCPQLQQEQQWHQHQQQQRFLAPAPPPQLPAPPNFAASPSFGVPNSGDIVWPWFDESAHDTPLLDAPELEKLLAPTPPGSRPPSPRRPPSPPRPYWPDSGSRPPSPPRADSRPPSPPRPRDMPNSRPRSPCRSEREMSPPAEDRHAVPETPALRAFAGGAEARTVVRSRAGTSSAMVEAELMHSVLGRLYEQLVQAASGGLIQQWAGTFDALVAELMQGGSCRDMTTLSQQEASTEIDLTRDYYPGNRVQHMQHTSIHRTL